MRKPLKTVQQKICPQCGGVKADKNKLCWECRYKTKDRIQQVITGLANSKTLKEIAQEWGRSVKTVEYFWAGAKAKFGLQCYQDCVKHAYREGWITL
jgi:DNA-binding NarL/FixJ family response regulator